jgi:hypothetical protein
MHCVAIFRVLIVTAGGIYSYTGLQTVEILLLLSEVKDILLQLEVSLIVNSILGY